jgi:hypothetical protein
LIEKGVQGKWSEVAETFGVVIIYEKMKAVVDFLDKASKKVEADWKKEDHRD